MMTGKVPKGVIEWYEKIFLKTAINKIFEYPLIKTVSKIKVPIF